MTGTTTAATPINLNRQIENFIRESNMRVNINERVMEGPELASIFNQGIRVWNILINTRTAANIALFSYNMYLWQVGNWNSKWIIPVATTGYMCISNTKLFNSGVRWLTGWFSGWNRQQTIRTGLLQARSECLFDVISVVGMMLGLSWRFSPLTWFLCMPTVICRGMFSGLGIYGLNYILRADVQRRLIDFLADTFSNIDADMFHGIITHNHSILFEDLVELRTCSESEAQTCPICMQDDQTLLAQIKECGHTFCQECLREWYNTAVRVFNCPLCRKNLEPAQNIALGIRNTLTQLFR